MDDTDDVNQALQSMASEDIQFNDVKTALDNIKKEEMKKEEKILDNTNDSLNESNERFI